MVTVRTWLRSTLAVATMAGLLAGCSGGTSSSGVRLITITGEELETVPGDLCAVRGNATNSGNVRTRVALRYEALNAMGVVIATSEASFEVAPFSNFEFRNSKRNGDGSPSSTVFTNGLACAGISTFRRSSTHTEPI